MTDNEKAQIRFNLAIQFKDVTDLNKLQELYEWIIGKQSNIVPVQSFQVKK